MDENTKREFVLLFNQGFEEVVLPEIERLSGEIKEVKTKLSGLQNQVDRLDRKLDIFSAQAMELDGRVTKLEAKQVAVS